MLGLLRSKLRLEEGWTSFLLLMLMLLSVVWSVRAANWTEGLGILHWVSIAAMLLGLILAKGRRIPGIVAHVVALVFGVAWVTVLLRAVFGPLAASGVYAGPTPSLVRTVQVMYQQALRWILNPGGVEAWLSNFMFVAWVAVVAWVLSYLSTWFVFRSHWVWGAIVPAGAGCVLNIYYAPPRMIVYFFFYCLSALLLAVRMHVYMRQVIWKDAEVNYNLDVDLTFLRDGMVVSVLALILAWTFPVAARSPRLADFWDEFQEPWQEVQTVWTRLFTSLRYQGQSGLVRFARTMTLGGGVNLSNVPVFEVQAREPHYWRAVAYDRYTGSGWANSDDTVQVVPADTPRLRPAPYAVQSVFTQTIRMREPGESLLFFAGQPVTSTRSARANVNYVVGPEGQRATDVSMLTTLRALSRDETYTITSLVSKATARQLRAAGSDYPEWVLERYLQLPSTLPRRIRNLAREIAQEARQAREMASEPITAYDQAEAVQNYLRRIPYDRAISAPPAGYDPIDWFLFENRRGYCDYYASAMAVMLRAIGIPARISQGYAAGEYLPASRSYQVRQLDAHCWPEVYFPGYGWVEFEPTASQPVIARPEQGASPALPEFGVLLPTERSEEEEKYGPDEGIAEDEDVVDVTLGQSRPWYRRLLPAALVLVGLLLGGVLAVVAWWYFSLRGLGVAESAYEQMRRMGGLMGVAHELHQTPVEYGASLMAVLAEGQDEVRCLVVSYVKQRFSKRGLSEDEQLELQERWQKLRLLMWRRVLRPRRRQRRTTTPAWVSSSSLRPPSSVR